MGFTLEEKNVLTINQRKADHIRINLEEDVGFLQLTNGLEQFRFVHQALPELDFGDVDTRLELFGKQIAAPILISSMTGGTARALGDQPEFGRRCASTWSCNGCWKSTGQHR